MANVCKRTHKYFNCYVSFNHHHQGSFGKIPTASKFFLNEGKKGGVGGEKKETDNEKKKEGKKREKGREGKRKTVELVDA